MRVGIFNQRRNLDKIHDLYMCLQSRLQEPGYKAGKRSIARKKNYFGIAMKSDSEIARGEERSEISRRKFQPE